MDQRRYPDGADHGQYPVLCHERQRAGEAEPQARSPRALRECVQKSQHQQRQRYQLQQIRIIFEALEIEDRVEREHHHDEEGAPTIDHA